MIDNGDWSVDRILSDCVKARSVCNTVELSNPHSTRLFFIVLV